MGLNTKQVYIDTNRLNVLKIPSGHSVPASEYSPSLGNHSFRETVDLTVTASDAVAATAVAAFDDLLNTELVSVIDAHIAASTGFGIDTSSFSVSYDARVIDINYGSTSSEMYLSSSLVSFVVTVDIRVYISAGATYYVRPSGGSYGAEDGSGYDDAWDGFSNINWGSMNANDVLYVCGTHNETLNILADDISVRFDYGGDAGIIDSEDTRSIGIQINNQDNVVLYAPQSIDATTSCLSIEGTSSGIITHDGIFTGSGNQGIQHLNTANATHNNVTCTGNADDGISAHDSVVVGVVGGTIGTNDEGVNAVGSSTVTISGGVTFTSNTTYDIFATNADSAESCVITLTGSTVADVMASLDAKVVLNDCTVTGVTESATSGVYEIDGSILQGNVVMQSTSDFTITDSRLEVLNNSISGTVDIRRSIILDDWLMASGGSIVARHCLFTGGNDHMVDVVSGASGDFKYCIFSDIASNKFGIAARTGASAITIENCTFAGEGTGKGIFAQVTTTANNCVFTGLQTGFHQTAGTATANDCVFYNNAADTAGTVTENNSETGDPELTDIAGLDFTFGGSSSCDGNGGTLSDSTGINTANWGNASAVPVVTTTTQGGSWDIGAHIG